MPRLSTIADLNQPSDVLAPLMEEAEGFSRRVLKFIEEYNGEYRYEVAVHPERSRTAGVHASELSHCQRQLVYSMSGEGKVPEKADLNMRQRFHVGHALHGMLQNYFELMASSSNGTIRFYPEVGINPSNNKVAAEWNIWTSCDGLFEFFNPTLGPEPYLRMGLELKSMSAPEFDKIKKPKDDHLEQSCVYMACLDMPLMWTLYYNKSNSNFTPTKSPYLFSFDHHRWDELQVRILQANQRINSKELPPRTEGKYCGWCAFSWTCQPPTLQRYKPLIVALGMRKQ